MSVVYVVREFYEGCSDESYVGVYGAFWRAASAAMGVYREYDEDYAEEGITPDPVTCEVFSDANKLWFERGEQYVTIDKMEVE